MPKKQIFFDAKYHTYQDESNNKYLSATRLVSQCFPKFDLEGISFRYAKKHNMTQDEVKKLWSDKGRRSADRGTTIHEYMFNKLNNNTIIKSGQESLQNYFNICDQLAVQITNKYYVYDKEMIVFDPEFFIAGTVDLILQDKEKPIVYIVDWKTNEKIEMKNDYKQYGIGEFEHLDHCNYNHYCVQLNLYEYMVRKMNLFPSHFEYKRYISHISEKHNVLYECIDLQEQINNLLKKRNPIPF